MDTHIEQLKNEKGKLYALQVDMTKDEQVLRAFEWIKINLGPIHVLINNAGTHTFGNLLDGETEEWRYVLELNVTSLCLATREAIRSMRENNIDGHIVHLNSIAGHYIPNLSANNVYPASKYAVTALTETLRRELVDVGSKIRITVGLTIASFEMRCLRLFHCRVLAQEW